MLLYKMPRKNMFLVKPKLQAKAVMTKGEIDRYIATVYEGISDKNSLKFLTSFILFVCCVVEEVYTKKSDKVNKRDEVIGHIVTFLGYNLSDEDRRVIVNIIEDLHSSRRIKRVSMAQQLIFTIGSFFLKKD